MNPNRKPSWEWIWPTVGPAPITEGLDSEIFDRREFPYTETFVREAIQNSLDARLDSSRPVRITFRFHKTTCASQRPFLEKAVTYRKRCEKPVPPEWDDNAISWLVVQDYNATGLSGDLQHRTSDFWNYWLNFGQSNKQASGRGGRGIGRVTFLIASRIETVIGYTRRSADKETRICGMVILHPIEQESRFLSTHAYLAKSIRQSIYNLHGGKRFQNALTKSFKFDAYDAISDTGLALAIPYPHKELTEQSILAAAIENFAPTILDGTLELTVGDTQLDRRSIDSIAISVSSEIREQSVASDPRRYVTLISHLTGQITPTESISILDQHVDLSHAVYRPPIRRIAKHIESNQFCLVDIRIPVRHEHQARETTLRAIVAPTPEGAPPLDRFFRDGMCLPNVRCAKPQDFDLLLFSGSDLLSQYLNLCEGKAHLDLSQSKAITAKLRQHRFDSPLYRIKNFIKAMPREFRQLLYGDVTQPDARVFENFFSAWQPHLTSELPDNGQPVLPDPPPTTIPKAFRLSHVKTGVRIVAERQFTDWPVNLCATFAYADGRRIPRWSEFDFKLEDLVRRYEGCEKIEVSGNMATASKCVESFSFQVTGFDSNRELIVYWSAS